MYIISNHIQNSCDSHSIGSPFISSISRQDISRRMMYRSLTRNVGGITSPREGKDFRLVLMTDADSIAQWNNRPDPPWLTSAQEERVRTWVLPIQDDIYKELCSPKLQQLLLHSYFLHYLNVPALRCDPAFASLLPLLGEKGQAMPVHLKKVEISAVLQHLKKFTQEKETQIAQLKVQLRKIKQNFARRKKEEVELLRKTRERVKDLMGKCRKFQVKK